MILFMKKPNYWVCTSMCPMYMMTFPPLLFTPALEANTTAENEKREAFMHAECSLFSSKVPTLV